MRIGLDLDGVLADFHARFIETIRDVTGRDLFPSPIDWKIFPAHWDFPLDSGYTPSEMARVWKVIWEDPTFWSDLDPYSGIPTLLRRLNTATHDIYFLTNRLGVQAKQQTEDWLCRYGVLFPTVLLTRDKGACAKALRLHALFDDLPVNIVNLPGGFLLDRPYNQGLDPLRYRRVFSVKDFLEGLHVLR